MLQARYANAPTKLAERVLCRIGHVNDGKAAVSEWVR